MQSCPDCAAALPVENLFCEVCGTALPAPDAADICPKCRAAFAGIDDEGFCCACGFRREERGRDHLEVIVSPALAGVSDRGLRHHRNEDFLVLRAVGAVSILIVSDGVSTVRDADIASAAAAARATISFEESLAVGQSIGPAEMDAALAAAHASVLSLSGPPADVVDGPAATIVAAVVSHERALIGWRGDSRAYWLDASAAQALTEDHSWSAEMLRAGSLSPAAIAESPQAHAITSWLGADAPDPPSAILDFPIPGPGALLLCSDGLWNYAPLPEDLYALFQPLAGVEAIACCRRLVEFARGKGGNDNISVAVLMFGDPRPDPLAA